MSKHVSEKPASAAKSPKAAAAKAKHAPLKDVTASASASASASKAAKTVDSLMDDVFLQKRLNKAALKRIFLRAGCTRTSGPHLYALVRQLVAKRLQTDVAGLVAMANHDRVKTLAPKHARHFYGGLGRTIYGAAEYK